MISRAEQYDFLDNYIAFEKKAFSIERISNGKKCDPFESLELGNVWKIVGNTVFRNEGVK